MVQAYRKGHEADISTAAAGDLCLRRAEQSPHADIHACVDSNPASGTEWAALGDAASTDPTDGWEARRGREAG